MIDASNKGWGGLCVCKPTFGLWSEEDLGLHINCLEMIAVCQACRFFLPYTQGHHVLVRSDSMCRANWTKGQTCCWGTMSLQRNARSTRSRFRKFGKSLAIAREDLFASEDNSHCPTFFTKSTMPLPRNGQPFALCIPSSPSATAGTQASQGTTAQAYSSSPPLEEPTVGVRVIAAVESSPVADHLEMGPPLSSKTAQYGIHGLSYGPCMCGRSTGAFHPPRACPKHYGTPSTRCLYTLIWLIFSAWCQDRDLDPVTSDVLVVLSFLQEMLDKQRSSSTIKVYTAAIAVFHAPFAGRSMGRDNCGNKTFTRR